MINQTISHYKILEKLGQGGMGVVYKAQDTKLNRAVALKFLPQDLTRDQETIDRFINEAQAASALDHANICTIHEISETEDGQMFIVMAYYAGETLQKKVVSGQLSVTSVIDIATQAAQGLERAHEAGITHRDIKPSNLIITPRGEVKIIDFGLAKLAGQTRLTKTGSTLGTVAYMSPEQVQAQPLDHRTDIWSLGVVLYEMLTGKLPFRGEYEAAMIYTIVNEKPEPLAKYRTDVPEGLQQVLDKALVKDVEMRYQHIDELLADLKGEKKTGSTSTKPISRVKSSKSKRSMIAYASVFVVAILAMVLGVWRFNRPSARQILPTHKQVTFTGDATFPAISPDGQFVAYATGKLGANQKVMVQDLAEVGQPLTVYQAKNCSEIRWSPDGAEFILSGDSIFHEILVPRLGGSSRAIRGRGIPCWSPDGSQIASAFENMKSILISSKRTGERADFSLRGYFNWLKDMDWSPLGDRLAILTQDLKKFTIWTIRIDGNQQHKIVEDSLALASPRWSGDGEAIYYLRSDGQTKNLMKVNIATKSGEARGTPSTLLVGLPFGDYFTLSRDNKRLLYTRAPESNNLWLVTLKNKGRGQDIETKQVTTGTSWVHDPAISPDGKRVAFSIGKRPRANIFVMPFEGGQMQQLTFLNSYNSGAAWSPDGQEIVFGSSQDDIPRVWKIQVSGGTPRPFIKSELSEGMFLLTWAPGANILYQRPGNQNYHFLNPETEAEAPLVKRSYGWMFWPRYSPDGKNVAVSYNRPEYGDSGLWLIDLESAAEKLLHPGYPTLPIKWSADGKWIYDWSFGKKVIFKVPINGGQPEEIITLPFENLDYVTTIDMTPDETRFIVPVLDRKSDVWLVENFDPENELQAPITAPDVPEMQQLTSLQNGWELQSQKKYAEAEKTFRKGLDLNSKHHELLSGLGWSLHYQKKYNEAENTFSKGLEMAPEHVALINGMCQATFYNKNYQAARRYHEKYLEGTPRPDRKVPIHIQLGAINLLLKDYTSAKKHLQNALSIDSTNAPAHRQWGYLFIEQGNYLEAEAYATKAVGLDSSFANHNLLALVLVAGEIDIERGIAFAEKALKAKPENWKQMIESYPYFAIPEHTLGLAYLKKGEYQKAVQYLEQAAAFAPERENLKVDLQLARQKLQAR